MIKVDAAKLQLADWQSALLVYLAVCAAVVLVGNAFKAIRDWRKPSTDESAMVTDHERRIAKLEEINKQRDTESAIIMRSLLAVLSHIINGDAVQDIVDSQKEIQNYLIKR